MISYLVTYCFVQFVVNLSLLVSLKIGGGVIAFCSRKRILYKSPYKETNLFRERQGKAGAFILALTVFLLLGTNSLSRKIYILTERFNLFFQSILLFRYLSLAVSDFLSCLSINASIADIWHEEGKQISSSSIFPFQLQVVLWAIPRRVLKFFSKASE